MLVALDEADQQRVDQHVVGPPSPASALVSAMPAARETEVGMLAGTRRLGADVEHVDDAAPAPLLHLRPHQADQADRGEQLLVKILLQDLVGERLELAVARGAGIVDDDVDLAERAHGLVVDALHVGRVPDVALHRGDASLRDSRRST